MEGSLEHNSKGINVIHNFRILIVKINKYIGPLDSQLSHAQISMLNCYSANKKANEGSSIKMTLVVFSLTNVRGVGWKEGGLIL